MTADILDAAQEIEQHILDARIRTIRHTQRQFRPKGSCHWCREPFEAGSEKVFCDSDCSDDHDKFKKQQR
jgi:hypothetical protein